MTNRVSNYREVFVSFFLLGFTSFGGPAAHIGYFRTTFVEQKGWLDDDTFGRFLALSQFLPGPGSSQLGFSIGLHRAGQIGGWLAFFGFTSPSFMLMWALASFGLGFYDQPWMQGIITGLKLLAVVVVIDACTGMYQSFCRETSHAAIALASAVVLILTSGLMWQVLVLIVAALVGSVAPSNDREPLSQAQRPALVPLLGLVFLFAVSLLPLNHSIFADFYLAGSLVFGGGHVVLPLLQEILSASIEQDVFLTGYAAAQAVPGPMFTLASFLGAELVSHAPMLGALVATMAIFLPGFLLLLAFQGSWLSLAESPRIAGVAAAVNAAVVGLLLAALYDPVYKSAVTADWHVALVIVGLFLLRWLKVNVAALAALFMIAGVLSLYLN